MNRLAALLVISAATLVGCKNGVEKDAEHDTGVVMHAAGEGMEDANKEMEKLNQDIEKGGEQIDKGNQDVIDEGKKLESE